MTYRPNPFRFNSSFSILRAFPSPSLGPSPTSGSAAWASLPPGSAGQLLVVTIGFRGTATFAMPSGWTQVAQVVNADTALGGQVSGLLAWKIRGASEPNPTFTRTGGGYATGCMVGYTPNIGGLTIDTSSTFAQASATTALSGTAITLAQANSLLFVAAIVAGQDSTANNAVSAASLLKTASPSGLVPAAATPVSRTAFGQAFWAFNVLGGVTGVSAMGFDVADVPDGSTGVFSGTSAVSSRGLMIAAAFRRI